MVLREACPLRLIATLLVISGLLAGVLPESATAQENSTATTANSAELSEADELIKQVDKLYEETRYKEAMPLAERALAIREKALGPEHPLVAQAVFKIANLSIELSDYGRAGELYRRSLATREKLLSPDHPDVAQSLGGLGYLCYVKGDYACSDKFHQRALAIRERVLGPEHPDVAHSLNELAVNAYARAEYTSAEPLYLRALAIREKTFGLENAAVARSVNNLGVLYMVMGDRARALPYLKRALAIYEKVLGPENTWVSQTLLNIGSALKFLGDLAGSEDAFKRSISIYEKVLGPDNYWVGNGLNNLGHLYFMMGDYARAEPIYQRSISIFERMMGPEHTWIATPLNNLAEVYSAMGDYARAEPLFQRALLIREKTRGPENPDVAYSLNDIAWLREALGDIKQAIALRARGDEISERNLSLILAIGSEEQKRQYMKTFTNETDATISLQTGTARNDAEALRLALTTVLRRKGRVLDAFTNQIEVLRRRSSAEDSALLSQLTTARSQLAGLVLKGPGNTDRVKHQAAIEKFKAEIEQIEQEVSAKSSQFRAQTQRVTIEDVQRGLPPGSALVEIMLYRPFDLKSQNTYRGFGAPRYVAYVLSREGEPSFAELGGAATIDAEVAKLRAALSNAESQEVKAAARSLDERLMRPVRRLLGNARRIFISPDGALNLIPFAALIDEQGSYLVEDYTIGFLSSGRDLLRLQVRPESRQGPLIVANPSFDQAVTFEARRGGAELKAAGSLRSVDFKQLRFSYLPGAESEARALGAILSGAKVLTGAEATEAALKQVSGPSLLHIATHGYFLPDQEQSRDNPLLRSGLGLAGANKREGGVGEDGVLTALEVAGLELWGTRLVVLSACETGVGDVRNGDGVYGLRRALVLAGAESQVMSLWQISDLPTRNLMVEYYKRLQRGEGRSEALRQAQLKMLKGKTHNHPFYWASFIQSGDWRSLGGNEPAVER